MERPVVKTSQDQNTDRGQGRFCPRADKRLTLQRRIFDLSGAAGGNDEEFELQFMERVIAGDPCNEDALMLLGHAYTHRGDYEKGLTIDRRLVRLRPTDPTAYYNLACSLSLLNQRDDAMVALQRAAALGYADVKYILKDPDLANLRQDRRFRRFIQRIGHPSES